MRVVEVAGLSALCEARGVRRDVSLWMLQHEEIRPGDHLLVHLGHAVQRMTEEEASETWSLLDQILGETDLSAAR